MYHAQLPSWPARDERVLLCLSYRLSHGSAVAWEAKDRSAAQASTGVVFHGPTKLACGQMIGPAGNGANEKELLMH
jgi:hypothetical protein